MSMILCRGLSMAMHAPKEPLLAIIGATGTGKSKLAVQLATRFNGEIVNGDAMQMYKGLPIITNKIPENERNGIPHHLLGFIGLGEQPWNVGNFVAEAQKTIQEIRSRGRLPILVGGTHYYTQALLFKDSLLAKESGGNVQDGDDEEGNANLKWPILSAPTSEIYAKLQEVDPAMAQRWHPKDRRHIRRSLEIWLQTGVKASDIYFEQEQLKLNPPHEVSSNGEALNGSEDVLGSQETLRWPTLLFWMGAEDGKLKERLNARVETMAINGLLDEANEMLDFVHAQLVEGSSLDRSRGIWVSIGFKEVEPYLVAARDGTMKDTDLSRLREQCIEAVKASTRQYAKRQNRWIRISLSNALLEASVLDRLFLLDCTELEAWSDSISAPSERIVEDFLKGNELPDPKSLSALAKTTLTSNTDVSRKVNFLARRCEDCDLVLMSELEWERHRTTKGHKKVLESRRRKAENEAQRRSTQLRSCASSRANE